MNIRIISKHIFMLMTLVVGTTSGITYAFSDDWNKEVNVNPINDEKRIIISKESTNTIKLSFPYNQDQHGLLAFRYGYKDQDSVLMMLRRGAFNCPVSCTVYVRADDGKAQKFTAATPNDFSQQNGLFIDGKKKLLRMIKQSKTLRIIFDVYDDGQEYFDFDVTNFPKM